MRMQANTFLLSRFLPLAIPKHMPTTHCFSFTFSLSACLHVDKHRFLCFPRSTPSVPCGFPHFLYARVHTDSHLLARWVVWLRCCVRTCHFERARHLCTLPTFTSRDQNTSFCC